MSLPFALPEPDGFDPFLNDIPGAEVARDTASVHRALLLLHRQEVLVATADGELFTGRMEEPLALRFSGDFDLGRGDQVAISDQRGIELIGFRATVGAVLVDGGARLARLFVPQVAIFYPGRQHVRIEGDLGADVTLETENDLLNARGLDVSIGGIGVLVSAADGFLVGQTFLVHLTFDGTRVSLPARARSAEVVGDDVRLGLRFLFHSTRSPVGLGRLGGRSIAGEEELARRIRAALRRVNRSPAPPR